jgi:formamidopyrimidine-DNA glycosylase
VPELPEVETVRRGIDRVALNRHITRVEVGRERTVRRTSREALIDGLSGARIISTRRHGKYLLCDLDSGDAVMIHLRMSGRVLVVDAGTPRPPHTHVVAHLEATSEFAAGELWFVDPRTFGEVVVFDPEHPEVLVPELARLGPDPLALGFTTEVLAERLRGKRTNLKATLLDQGVVAGIGNIYADEILHRAKLSPHRTAGSLRRATIERLHTSIVAVLERAVEAGGSTLTDTQYVDIEGNEGWFQLEHRVYGRAGESCLTCRRARISRTTLAGRTTCYCGVCQR